MSKVGCNLYGLCVNGLCMSRCLACRSDTGDLHTVKFHLANSKEPYSRWQFNSVGSNGEYSLKIDGSYGFLVYNTTPRGDSQLTLSTQLSDRTKFQFVEVEQVKLEDKVYNVQLVGK